MERRVRAGAWSLVAVVGLALMLAGGLSWGGARSTARAQPARSTAQSQTSNVWHIARVDAPKYFRYMTDRSLRLDAAGHPHIAYGSDNLYYAWHDSSAWLIQTVDGTWGVSTYTSLGLGASSHPHISYYDSTNGALKYAHWTGSAWSIQTVDDGIRDCGGGHTSLALDADAHPHISYHDGANGDLKYAHWTGWPGLVPPSLCQAVLRRR